MVVELFWTKNQLRGGVHMIVHIETEDYYLVLFSKNNGKPDQMI